ncbi:hypothetical protein IAU60_005182 [Kwoniella sp. DSM 27419]
MMDKRAVSDDSAVQTEPLVTLRDNRDKHVILAEHPTFLRHYPSGWVRKAPHSEPQWLDRFQYSAWPSRRTGQARKARRASWGRGTADYRSFLLILGALCLSLFGLFVFALHFPVNTLSKLDGVIELQETVARDLILANIGPPAGAADGLVIASPSHGERSDLPDYYFTWTRDSALVFSSLHSKWLSDNSTDPLYETLFRTYIASQTEIQSVEGPSGNLWTGGLNEPKFYVNKSAFTGSWGRPQRDGPALRALAIIPYAHMILNRGYPLDVDYVKKHLYDPKKMMSPGNTIKNDLEEVTHGWWKGGFDLWEEVNGQHLFTLLASQRALEAGAVLAFRLRDPGAAAFYQEQVDAIHSVIEQFWDGDKAYYRSSLNHLNLTRTGMDWVQQEPVSESQWPAREWLDCSIPLSIIHAGSPAPVNPSSQDQLLFDPTNARVLSTIYQYILSFDKLYGINYGSPWTDGWAVGRYKEDVYDGVRKSEADPWFICTHSVAQVLFQAKCQFAEQGYIASDRHTVQFWSDLVGRSVKADEVWSKNGSDFKKALDRRKEVGDAFMRVSSMYWDNGHMSEQIDRVTGHQRGARDLTWSYASFLTAAKARREA